MAITSLKDAFPRMSIIESQGRALKQVAFGMLPFLMEALEPKQGLSPNDPHSQNDKVH